VVAEAVVAEAVVAEAVVAEAPDLSAISFNLLSIFINPQAEDISTAKSDNPNLINRFGERLLGK
jgi:hypothetical protein